MELCPPLKLLRWPASRVPTSTDLASSSAPLLTLFSFHKEGSLQCLYPALLVLQIHGCRLINTRDYVAFVCYLVMDCQPFPLTLRLPAASVSLLLLFVCAHITELFSFITRHWLPIRSFFVVLWLLWCLQIVLGDMSHFSTIVAHRFLLLTNALHIIHLFLYWIFPEGLERSLCLKSILYIFFSLQHNCYDFIQGCISHRLYLCLYKSLQPWF